MIENVYCFYFKSLVYIGKYYLYSVDKKIK